MLLENLNHHGAHNVTALKLALGKQSGSLEDSICRIWGKEPEKQIYPFTTIDEFVKKHRLRRLDCIKIDVDSFDFEVLQGAESTLADFNPYVVVELGEGLNTRNQTYTQALNWMAGLDYQDCLVLELENFLFKRGMPLTKNQDALNRISILFDRTKGDQGG